MEKEIRQKLERFITENEYIQNLGLHFSLIEEGHAIAQIPYRHDLCNPYGSLHGGVLYSLADIVSGVAACTYGHYATTTQGNMNYLLPAFLTEYVQCEARVARQGKHIAVYQVEIRDDKQQVLQTGSFQFYLMEKKLTQ